MTEELRLICEIQRLDSGIRQAGERLAQVPVEIGRLEAALQSARGRLQQGQGRQQELAKGRKALEQQVEDINAAIRKHQTQVFEVKTNKEYTTMLHEIEGEKRRIGDIEERTLAIMEEADQLAHQEKDLRRDLQEIEQRVGRDRAALDQEAGQLRAQHEELQARRGQLLARLPPEILASYQRIAGGRNGLAVVPVAHGACGGCGANLPTKAASEIQVMEEIYYCEACGRILVWPEDGDAGAAGGRSP
jgi:hypothetical protein